MNRWAWVALVALLALGVAYVRAATPVPDNTSPEDAADVPAPDALDAAAQGSAPDPAAIMDRNALDTQRTDNAVAFLAAIAYSEGTDGRGGDPYRVCYAYRHTVQSLADHPAVTGEWAGESLANLGPAYAGKVSTAAGRYQIIRPTWLGIKKALALPDFGPDSQDAAALYLIRMRGALDDVQAGRFDQAVAKCAKEWASLPGANAPGQAMRRMDDLRTAFLDAGGVLA